MNVLVTAIGSFAADIVIKKLQDAGAKVIGTDIYPKEWVVDAYRVDHFYQVSPCSDEIAYIEEVAAICKKHDVDYLIPLTDVEVDVLNRYRETMTALDTVLCFSDRNTIELCRNKERLMTYVQENAPFVSTIKTVPIGNGREIPFDYPFICKPKDGRSSQGLCVIRSREGWNAFSAEHDTDGYIAQPFIEGTIVTADVVCSRDKATAIARRERLRTLNGAGLSVEVFRDKALEACCKKLARALNILGCVNFEYIQDGNGAYRFLECNPRFSGGVEFSCMAGYDCVMNHMRCFSGEEIDDFELKQELTIARKYEEYITVRKELT